MPFPEHLSEADRRECIANLRAFVEADKKVQQRRLTTGISSTVTHTTPTHTTGKRSPARKPPIRQAHFLNNNKE